MRGVPARGGRAGSRQGSGGSGAGLGAPSPKKNSINFLPHYSSEYFRKPVIQSLEHAGLLIPQERWFTNLGSVGNVGSASIYIMLDKLLKSGRMRDRQHALCCVPESGRFSSAFIYLTAIAHA